MSYQKFSEYKDKEIVLLVEEGNFFTAYLDDAYVLNYLFSFKLIHSNHLVKVSFSKNILYKVKNVLELRCVSYSILEDNLKITIPSSSNQYLKYLNQEVYLRDKLLEKLENLSYSELLSITQDFFKL